MPDTICRFPDCPNDPEIPGNPYCDIHMSAQIKITFTLPAKLAAQFKTWAIDHDYSQSRAIRAAIRKIMEEEK